MSLFDNCLILAPDNEPLSRCARQRAEWYLQMGLADQVSTDPLTIRLLFEPKARNGAKTDPLLACGKPNMCVVCGTEKDLSRHHIVPHCFIRYFPLLERIDCSLRHIFGLCRKCHQAYEELACEKKIELARRFNVHYSPKLVIGSEEAKHHFASGAANTLLKHRDKLPSHAIKKLEGNVRTFLGRDQFTQEDLKVLQGQWPVIQSFGRAAKEIMEKITDYNDFIEEWRQHFVEFAKPKHMPAGWNITRAKEDLWMSKLAERRAEHLSEPLSLPAS